ncbi:beta-glucosidase [Candidatus Magnetomorum sp. HK-1]|nr:beta-glucosidase [Candidatus Magnetomorum sp. HK-1]
MKNKHTKAFTDIEKLSLEEKIGMTLMVGVSGHHPDKTMYHRMEKQYISAYLLFQKNTPDIETTKSLTDELHHMADKLGVAPLLVAIDQEHGRVIRLKKGVTRLPAAYGLGRLNNPIYVQNACYIAGQELRALGININFAPVADINSNPENPIIGTRSFGENPSRVSEMVRHAVRGYKDAGIICSAKHFPGHGDVSIDSHLDLPVSKKSLDELHKTELLPFKAAISESVPMIMTAHIAYPEIDSNNPATLSPVILTQLLREEMHYDGIIISDDLEMKALNRCGEITDLAIKMINAGCDMLIISENLTHDVSVDDIYQALFRAVQDKIISIERLNKSIKRILNLRQGLLEKDDLQKDIIRHSKSIQASHHMMREIFFENPHSKHFPISCDPNQLCILSDIEDILNICPGIHTRRLLLNKELSKEKIQSLLATSDEIFIFLSRISYLELLETIDWQPNQKIRFFSLNNPYIQTKINLRLSSYINLYAECLPLSVFDDILFK